MVILMHFFDQVIEYEIWFFKIIYFYIGSTIFHELVVFTWELEWFIWWKMDNVYERVPIYEFIFISRNPYLFRKNMQVNVLQFSYLLYFYLNWFFYELVYFYSSDFIIFLFIFSSISHIHSYMLPFLLIGFIDHYYLLMFCSFVDYPHFILYHF